MKKKILEVCEAFGGGVFAYVSQLCNDMCDTFEVYLAYGLRSQTPTNFKELLDERIHLIEVPNFHSLKKIGKSVKFLRKIEQDIQPDIIHLHSSLAGGIGRIAFKKRKNNTVYTPHGYAHILLGKGFKSFVYKCFEKKLGNRAISLTCCESENEEAKKFSKRTSFIETGIDVEAFDKVLQNINNDKADKKFTVFTLGRICTQKQPKVFNKIATLAPNINFVWIGDGELRKELTAPNIRITGWLPRMEALKIAKTADVFVLCSLGEAIAMSLLENMYLKKLCLVSNTIGNSSVINDGINGYVCERPEDYATRIIESEKFYPSACIIHAFDDVLKIYNREMMKEKYVSFYSNLIESQHE